MKHAHITRQERATIIELSNEFTVRSIADKTDRSYSTIFKFMRKNNIDITHEKNRWSSKKKNFYTHIYPIKLFALIKKLESEIDNYTTPAELIQLQNMREEYREAIESNHTSTTRYKFRNVAVTIEGGWHPKVTIVNS